MNGSWLEAANSLATAPADAGACAASRPSASGIAEGITALLLLLQMRSLPYAVVHLPGSAAGSAAPGSPKATAKRLGLVWPAPVCSARSGPRCRSGATSPERLFVGHTGSPMRGNALSKAVRQSTHQGRY